MHPGLFGWFHGCGPSSHGPNRADCSGGWRHGGPFGGGGPWRGRGGHGGPPDGDDGGGFGVKRPLRFLAWKLELEEPQVEKLAAILDELKIERAQASVDNRRSIGALADSVEGDAFDQAKAKEAGAARVKTAERLGEAVVTALGKMHAELDAEQRKRLAYLLRTGTLSI